MSTGQHSPMHTAYLLRCWLDGNSWRYSLEQVGSCTRQGFATLDEFVTFLIANSSLPAIASHAQAVENKSTEADKEVSARVKSSSSKEAIWKDE